MQERNGLRFPQKRQLAIFARHFTAAIFWMYTIITVFVFNVDGYAISLLGAHASWIIQFKFVILVGLLSAFWLINGTKQVTVWTIFILFYPFVLLFHLGFHIWKAKNWLLAIALITVLLSFARAFKFNFIAGSLIVSSACICIFTNIKSAIALSSIVLFVLLVTLIVRRAISIFRPSRTYEIHSTLVEHALNYGKSISLPPQNTTSVALANMQEDVKRKWVEGLQMIVLLNRSAYFLSVKLDAYKQSGISAAFHAINYFVLLAITLIILATINYSTFQIYPDAFTIIGSPQWFDFLYYSFNSMVGNHLDDFKPIANISKTLFMLGIPLSLTLTGILLSLIFSVRLSRDQDEIAAAAHKIKMQADEMEGLIRDHFGRTIPQALEDLQIAKSAIINLLFFLHERAE